MSLFWLVWGFDALVALVVLYFFFWGVADGSVSSFNIGLWVAILAAVGGVVLGGLRLRSLRLLLVLFVPAFLVLLFFLAVLVSQPRWN